MDGMHAGFIAAPLGWGLRAPQAGSKWLGVQCRRCWAGGGCDSTPRIGVALSCTPCSLHLKLAQDNGALPSSALARLSGLISPPWNPNCAYCARHPVLA